MEARKTEISVSQFIQADAKPTKKKWAFMLESLKKTAENHPEAGASMLIRKPVHEVFEALINPEITSKFWFTEGSSRLEFGIELNLIADHNPQ